MVRIIEMDELEENQATSAGAFTRSGFDQSVERLSNAQVSLNATIIEGEESIVSE